jgi:hypothetical protein
MKQKERERGKHGKAKEQKNERRFKWKIVTMTIQSKYVTVIGRMENGTNSGKLTAGLAGRTEKSRLPERNLMGLAISFHTEKRLFCVKRRYT